jgi:hypothetical protein
MVSGIPTNIFGPNADLSSSLVFLIVLVISLLLIFAGRSVIKAVAFLVGGLAGAAIASQVAGHTFGALGTLLGGLLGFVIGGFIAMLLLVAGIGLAIGYAGYYLASNYFGSELLAIIVGAVLFIIGVFLAGRILSLVSAVIGGLLLFDLLTVAGLGSTLALVIAALATVLGIWVQNKTEKKPAKPVPQPSSPTTPPPSH